MHIPLLRPSVGAKNLLAVFLLICCGSVAVAQNIGINTDGSTPDASAMLDINATDRGLLIPRLTALQRIAISTPATGLLVYQTEVPTGFWYYTGTAWLRLAAGVETYETVNTASVTLTNANTYICMTGLMQTVTLTTDSKVRLHAQGAFQTNSIDTYGESQVDIGIFQDGVIVPTSSRRIIAANTTGYITMIANFSTDCILSLGPGTYVFATKGTNVGGGSSAPATLGGDMTSHLQGIMDIVVYPQ